MSLHQMQNQPAENSILSRRRCLATIASAIGIEAIPPHLAFSTTTDLSKNNKAIRIGCSGRSFYRLLPTDKKAGTMTIDDFIARAAEWNTDCIELLDTNLLKPDAQSLHELKRKTFLAGIELSALTVYSNFIKPDAKDAENEITRIKQWIDHTAAIGAPMLVVFPGSAKRGVSMDASIQLVTEAMKKLADYAAKQGVILALENHGLFVDDATAVLKVLEKVDHPWFGINLDTGNFKHKPYDNIALLAPKAINCHLKVEFTKGGKKEPADLPKIFNILREANYQRRVILQYEMDGDPMVDVPQFLKRMQKLGSQTAS